MRVVNPAPPLVFDAPEGWVERCRCLWVTTGNGCKKQLHYVDAVAHRARDRRARVVAPQAAGSGAGFFNAVTLTRAVSVGWPRGVRTLTLTV